MITLTTSVVSPRRLSSEPLTAPPPVLKGKVRVAHGSSDGTYDLVGVSITSVRLSLIHDLNIPADAVAFVNGVQVSSSYRLQPNDFLEFFCQGRKGVGENVWTEEEFCKFFKITTEDLHAWIAEGLKVKPCLDGSIRITATAADDFFRGQVVQSPYLNAEQAAAYLRTTIKGIYSLLERRKLKKLRGSRTVLFTREMLDAYVQGGEK
jgi:hypothetical protein